MVKTSSPLSKIEIAKECKEVEMVENKGASSGKASAVKSEWIDISLPLHTGMVFWPGDASGRAEAIYDVEKGDPSTLWEMTIRSHTGTHIDAPRHFLRGGATIDTMPLETVIGPALVIESKDPVSIKAKELEPYNIQSGERILFKTQNSERCYKTDEFVEDYVYVTPEAARFLRDKKVRVVGLDYIAIGPYNDMEALKEVHEVLLTNGIWIIEALNLSGVKPGRYELICLPLRLDGGDACPSRAVLRPI
jgi:arylformamidase